MSCDKPPEKEPSRWMALDIGSKRIGVAVSDCLKLTARPLLTVERQSLDRDIQRILELAQEQGVSRVIVGRPMELSGSRSTILDLVERFADQLRHQSDLQIDWADERFSTKAAEFLMSEHGIKVSKRKAMRDQYAAALILTWYLEETTTGI